MRLKILLSAAFVLSFFQLSFSKISGKELAHFISLPIVDGAGIYTSVLMIQEGSANSRAAAISNLSLLAINGGLGMTTKFSSEDTYLKMRKIHRFVGFAVTGASIWMAVSAGLNDNVKKGDKAIAAGYSVMTLVPIIVFSF